MKASCPKGLASHGCCEEMKWDELCGVVWFALSSRWCWPLGGSYLDLWSQRTVGPISSSYAVHCGLES